MKKLPFFKMASSDAHRNHRPLLPSSLGPRLLLLTFIITLTCLCTAPTYAAPSSGPDPGLDMDASFFGATDIVRPSIYSYTITNPTKQLLREQDQQQRQQLEQQQKLKQQQQQQQLSSNDIAYSNNNNNKHRNHSNKNNKNNNNNNNNDNVNNKNLMNTQNYRSGNTNRNLYYINNNNNNNNNVRSNKNKIRNHTHSNNNMSEIHNNSKISNANNNNNLKNTYYSSYSPSYAPTLSTASSYLSPSEFSGVSSPTASISSGFSPSSSFSLSSLSSPVPSNVPAPSASLPVPVSGCNMDRLAVYKVVLHTYWTRDLFPKHFPDWRPTAQWTKTIGRTHDAAYALYHIGQQATSGVKQFAETGKSDIIDSMAAQQQQQTQQKLGNSFTSFVPSSGSPAKSTQAPQQQQRQQQQQQQKQPLSQNGGERSSVFDEFAIPAITTGAGRSETKFFVDSNHSFVSLMTRIVPSPDWFIGVDSFQLCVGGSWIDTVTIEMDPLDAGTDNGFTFTAPNWPTSPQGVIYRITSRYPAHPAGSFFYPKSKRLPPIATYQLIKLKEYDLSEVFNFAEDDRKYETVRTQTHLETEHNHVEMNNELSASIERERQNEATPVPTSVTERDRIRSQLLAKMNPMNNASNVVPKNDKHALMQNIAESYHRRGADGRSSSVPSKRRRTRRQRDCRVSHWSEWSACSKSCGIGEMNRYRKVIKHGKRGGRPCPALQQSKWCGSEKGCHNPENYFNWSIT